MDWWVVRLYLGECATRWQNTVHQTDGQRDDGDDSDDVANGYRCRCIGIPLVCHIFVLYGHKKEDGERCDRGDNTPADAEYNRGTVSKHKLHILAKPLGTCNIKASFVR